MASPEAAGNRGRFTRDASVLIACPIAKEPRQRPVGETRCERRGYVPAREVAAGDELLDRVAAMLYRLGARRG
jgi:hypothetical protein